MYQAWEWGLSQKVWVQKCWLLHVPHFTHDVACLPKHYWPLTGEVGGVSEWVGGAREWGSQLRRENIAGTGSPGEAEVEVVMVEEVDSQYLLLRGKKGNQTIQQWSDVSVDQGGSGVRDGGHLTWGRAMFVSQVKSTRCHGYYSPADTAVQHSCNTAHWYPICGEGRRWEKENVEEITKYKKSVYSKHGYSPGYEAPNIRS